MNRESIFFNQAELMLQVIPFVAKEACFALKGGTAINFFHLDMPRLSVDIDLTYVPIEPREDSLKKMSNALSNIADRIEKAHGKIKVQRSKASGGKRVTKLFVTNGKFQIKIEPNEVIRGTVFPTEERELSDKVQEEFSLSATIHTLSFADLYGGKLCAALDRQHPRDIFDVKALLEERGITDDIRKAFVVYLASHDRPIHELIDPVRKDIRQIYEKEFTGMTVEPIAYDKLVEIREKYIVLLSKCLLREEREFLLSIKEGTPNWKTLGVSGIERLPAIQWKLENIKKMKKEKHADAVRRLKEKLGL